MRAIADDKKIKSLTGTLTAQEWEWVQDHALIIRGMIAGDASAVAVVCEPSLKTMPGHCYTTSADGKIFQIKKYEGQNG